MKGKIGTIARIGAFAALALLLSGCIKLTMDLNVQSDNTVSGTVQLGIQKDLLELSGGSIDDLLGSDSPFPSDAPGVTTTDFDDGTFAGKEFTFDSVPLTEFANSDSPDSLSITRQGDTFVVSGVLDMSSALSGATGGLGASGQALFDSAVIKITMTFPGAVQEASGTISGNSVTWEPKFGERLEISATASAVDNGEGGGGDGDGGGSSMTIILIIVGVLIVGAIIAFFVMKGRKGSGGGEGVPAEAAPGAPVAPVAPGAPAAPAVGGEAPPVPPAAPPAPPAPPAE